MRLLKVLILSLVILAPLGVQAQPGRDWRVVAFEPGGAAAPRTGIITVFSPSGVSARYALPSSIFPADPGAYPQVVISPDLRYAAIAFNGNGTTPAPSISVIDLTQNLCCVAISPLLPNVQGYSLSGFSPDSRQLAYAYVAYTDPNTFSPAGGLIVADAASGSTVSSLSLEQMRASTSGGPQMAFAQTGPWTAQGVRFTPSCWACEGVQEGPWYVWDPSNNLVGTLNNDFFTVFGDQLPSTGELLYTIDNTNYPSAPIDGMFPPGNVVEYYPHGLPQAGQGGQTSVPQAPIVYYNPSQLALTLAHWVADGAAFVVKGTDTYPSGTVVFRNQTKVNTNFGGSDMFLAGTPDGWLAQDATNAVNRYVVNGSSVTVSSFGGFGQGLRAVWSTPLGSARLPPFTLIAGALPSAATPTIPPPPQSLATIPPPPSNQGVCAGAPPPRLVVGGQAQVTPGSPNNLRSSPSTTAPVLGLIPGGAVFTVVSGPVCASPADGFTWWGVNYNGKLGWTAEGRGTDYYVRPLP